jgi:hypothetical protein
LTVTGLVTAGSATITGALTVDTTTLVVDATNNRVGIGTATPAYPLQVVGNAVFNADATCKRFFVNDTTGNANVYINSANGSQSLINLGGQTNYNSGSIIYDDASNYLLFRTNSVEAARFNSTGNLVFPSAKGIDFSAVTGGTGTATATVLNDYEEGTFVPTIVGNTIAGVGVYVNQVGTYTKIGNQVTIWVNIEWSSHTGTGTQMYIGGFPFSLRTSTGYNAYAALGYINNIALTAGNFPLILAGSSDSFARFFQSPTGGGAATAVPMDTAGQVGFSLSYQV